MQNFLSALLGAVAGATMVALFLTTAAPSVPVPPVRTLPASASAPAPQAARALDLEDLEARLRALESAAIPSRTRIQSEIPDAQRIAAVEREVDELARQLSRFQRGTPRSPEITENVIYQLSLLSDRGTEALLAEARIPLRLQFLESWPDHENASRQLEHLVSDLVQTGQELRAATIVEQFGARIGASSWQLDKLLLRAASEPAEVVGIANRIINSDAPAGERAWAMVRAGDALGHSGDLQRAVQMLDRAIAEFSGVPETEGVISIATQRRKALSTDRD